MININKLHIAANYIRSGSYFKRIYLPIDEFLASANSVRKHLRPDEVVEVVSGFPFIIERKIQEEDIYLLILCHKRKQGIQKCQNN